MQAHRIQSRAALVVFLLLAAMLAPRAAFAAGEQTGRLRGVLSDKDTRTTLPNASITISSNVLIGGKQTKLTKADGSFEFTQLPPGIYLVEISYEGVKPIKRQVEVQLGTVTPIEIAWSPEIEGFEENVVVEAKPQMNPDSTQSGAVLSAASQAKVASPRTYQTAARQVAGVSGAPTAGNPNIRGGNSIMNRYLIDGLDVTDPVTNTFSANINFDSIGSIQVLTGGLEAQYNSLGGIINLVSSQGTADWHVDGSLYGNHYLLSAPNQFGSGAIDGLRPFSDTILPPTQSYQGNLTVGGPLLKDKLWINVGMQYQNTQASQPLGAPLNVQAPPRVFTAVYPRLKVTYAPSSKHRLTLSTLADPASIDYIDNNGALANQRTPLASRHQNQGGLISILLWDWFLSDVASTKLQVGYQLQMLDNGPQGHMGKIDFDAMRGKFSENNLFYDYTRPRHLNLDDQTAWYNAQFNTVDRRHQFNSEGAFFYRFSALGSHEAQAGIQGRIAQRRVFREVPGGRIYNDSGGGPGEAGLCDEIAGTGGCFQRQDTPAYRAIERGGSIGTYIQDRWKPRPWLTILPGLRFDYGTSWDGDGRQVSNLAGFGPRLGAVVDLTRDGKTLFSAYYGRANEVLSLLAAANATSGALTQNYDWDRTSRSFVLTSTTGGPGGTLVDPANTKAPHTDLLQVGLRRELGRGVVAGVEYFYKRFSNIWDIVETNYIWDPSGTRVVGYRNGQPKDIYLITTPDGNYNIYQAVDFTLQGSPAPNWEFYSAYTLSFKYGPGADSLAQLGLRNQFFNPRQAQFYDGYAYGDVRHQLKISGSYTAGPLTIGPNFSWQSGEVVAAVYQTGNPQAGTLLRSPVGTQPGRTPNGTPNDLNSITEFRTPDLFNIDLRVTYDLNHLIGQRLFLIADAFNVFNLGGGTAVAFNDTPAFGTITARQQPFRMQLGLRYMH